MHGPPRPDPLGTFFQWPSYPLGNSSEQPSNRRKIVVSIPELMAHDWQATVLRLYITITNYSVWSSPRRRTQDSCPGGLITIRESPLSNQWVSGGNERRLLYGKLGFWYILCLSPEVYVSFVIEVQLQLFRGGYGLLWSDNTKPSLVRQMSSYCIF